MAKKFQVVIQIVSEKGGVGKTTTAMSLTHYLWHAGYTVAVVELDGQGSISSWQNAYMRRGHKHAFASVAEADVVIYDGRGEVGGMLSTKDKHLIVPTQLASMIVGSTTKFISQVLSEEARKRTGILITDVEWRPGVKVVERGQEESLRTEHRPHWANLERYCDLVNVKNFGYITTNVGAFDNWSMGRVENFFEPVAGEAKTLKNTRFELEVAYARILEEVGLEAPAISEEPEWLIEARAKAKAHAEATRKTERSAA